MAAVAKPCLALLLFNFGIRLAAATGAHAIVQRHTFTVAELGNVHVQMAIEFHVAPGATLVGSYKSILDNNGTKSLQGNIVARDDLGNVVEVELRTVDDWLQAAFVFPEPVDGSVNDKYTLTLEYTIVNGICSGDNSFRFYFPWAHRWAVPVTGSTYKIQFPNNTNITSRMNEVCLAGTAFTRLCGNSLQLQGASAEHSVPSFAHGLFFEWPELFLPDADISSVPACPECGAEDGCVAEVQALPPRSQDEMLPQAEDIKTSTASTVVVILAILLCCTIAVFSILLHRKLRQWAPAKMGDSSHPKAPLNGTAKSDAAKPYSKFEHWDDEAPREVHVPQANNSNGHSTYQAQVTRPQPLPPPMAEPDALHRASEQDNSHDSWYSHPPQAIGSTAPADISLQLDPAPNNFPARTPSQQSGASHSTSASLTAAQRHWQGLGNYYEGTPSSPRSAGSQTPHFAAGEVSIPSSAGSSPRLRSGEENVHVFHRSPGLSKEHPRAGGRDARQQQGFLGRVDATGEILGRTEVEV